MSPGSSIRMGRIAVAKDHGVLRTLLGSCIGVALYDRAHRVAGLAHVVLPTSQGIPELPGKYMDTAIPAVLDDMARLVGRAVGPTARIAGGANMFATEVVRTIGLQNIEACDRILGDFGIPIVGRHCGGEKGRRMSLDAESGTITIEVVGSDPVALPDRPPRVGASHG
jgi:chemotaxis protein CheD